MQLGHRLAKEIANSLSAHVLTPLLNIIYYFTFNLGGLYSILKYLASQATKPPLYNFPQSTLPYIFIVLNTLSTIFNLSIIEAKL